MLMHTPAPMPRPFAQPFPPGERAAALWACACALLVLRQAAGEGDPEAAALRALLPGLPAAVAALQSGDLRPEHVRPIGAALVAALHMCETLPAEVWAALGPPPVPVLEAARARALALDTEPGLRNVQA